MKRTLIASAAAFGMIGLGVGAIAVADGHKGHHGKMGKHSEMRAEMLEKFDANGDGKLDETERNAARLARFAEIDADGSGSLTKQEITDHQMARMQARIDARFSSGDANADGIITVEEFEAAREMRKANFREMRENRRAEMLEKFDADGDGQLSRAERSAARDAGYKRGHRSKFGRGPAE